MQTAVRKSGLPFLPIGMWEYLLVANIPGAINALLQEEKEVFAKKYLHAMAARTRPHITIANFLANEGMESTLIRWIQNICNTSSSFMVDLNNYSGFPPHTVYLRVQDPSPFKMFGSKLKPVAEYIKNSGCPACKIVPNPHLSIARSLSPDVYERAIADYSQQTFHESFMLDELVLLRRQTRYEKCETVQVFKLKHIFE